MALLATAVLTCTALAGCGSSPGTPASTGTSESKPQESASQEGTQEQTPASDPQEIVDLVWYSVGNGMPDNYDAWKANLDAYLEEKIGVHLDVQVVSWSDWDGRRNTIVSTNEPYDIIFGNGNNYIADINLGAYYDITDMIDANMPGLKQLMQQRTVSLIVSRPDSALFWTNIIHRMAQELSYYKVNLLYTYVPSVYTKSFSLPPILQNGSVDGIVVLNVYDTEILGMINALSVPKVFLDTVPSLSDRELNGDLLLIEGFRTEADITNTLIQDGHTEIGFLGDIDYAMTNLERYHGYCDCMKKQGLAIRPEYCLTGRIDIFSYEKELYTFLNQLKRWPTAFVCASDFVANFVQSYIDSNSAHVPHPVALTGFDNTGEYANVAGRITTANVPTGLLGKRLALQMLFRSEHPESPHELTFIKPSIIIPLKT